MPRIQILELPTEHHGDDMTTPYLLVIDQVPRDEPAYDTLRQDLGDNDLTARTGARAVLCFEATVDIPANTVEPGEQTYPVTFQVLPDFTEFRAQVEAELRATREHLASHIRAQVDEELRHATSAINQTEPRGPIPRPRPNQDGGEHSRPDEAGQP